MMKELAKFFKALSDETRLQIVVLLLMKDELCVCDIENSLEMTQSKASRHLRYLVNAGVLTDRRHNIWVYYSINSGLNEDEFAILEALKKRIGSDIQNDLYKKLENWLRKKTCHICGEK